MWMGLPEMVVEFERVVDFGWLVAEAEKGRDARPMEDAYGCAALGRMDGVRPSIEGSWGDNRGGVTER